MKTKEIVKSRDLKYVLSGGKGGLGKTTLLASLAYWLSKKERRVVVFSTDPQASLTDIFERKIFGLGESKSPQAFMSLR